MKIVVVLIVFSLLVLLRFSLFYTTKNIFTTGQIVSFQTVLLDDPTPSGNYQRVSVVVGDFWHGQKATLYLSQNSQMFYGQSIKVVGKVKQRSLDNKQITTAIYSQYFKAENSGFLPFFGTIRRRIIDFCENNFSQPYSGLLVGIVFGIKQSLSAQITRSFRITGLLHIVAASGMNISLVGGFLLGILRNFLKRQTAILLTIAGILFYTLLSGLDPSIIRAALMGIIAFSAQLLGRQYTPLFALFLTACVMLFVDPLLLSDVGFQLSFFATLGILYIKPLFPKTRLLDDVATTLAAQLATLPILLSAFGQYSILSVLVNALVLWTIPPIMILGGIGIIIGLVIPFIGKLLFGLCLPLLWYLVGVVNYFGRFSGQITIQNLPWEVLVGYYMLLIAGVWVLQIYKNKAQFTPTN